MDEAELEDEPEYQAVEPPWKSFLYQLQQKAPKPKRVIFSHPITNKPPFYGKEYHGPISRHDAEQLVSECEGYYLTRESQRQPGTYALTFRFGGVSRNYRLYFDDDEKMHYVGEKRFETINDLVADGLITMYVDTNGKDYIDHMSFSIPDEQVDLAPEIPERHYDERRLTETSRTEQTKRISFKPSDYAKEHNFKVHNFYGPHWCDYCRNFLWGLKAQGSKCQDCGYNAHKPCSIKVLKTCAPDKKLVKRVFGVDLTTLAKAHNRKLPIVVDSCVHELEERGLDAEGLYRVPGFADDIECLKNTIDKDGTMPDISTQVYDDINVIAGLCKLYFRSLPIPLVTFDTYGKFIEASKIEDKFERTKAFHEAVSELPPAHYETLKYLMQHLQRVSRFRDKNLMNPHNLGVVFGPTLMRLPDSEALAAIHDLPNQRQVVEHLLEDQDVLFST